MIQVTNLLIQYDVICHKHFKFAGDTCMRVRIPNFITLFLSSTTVLEIGDPCWHYTSEDPVFICTVQTMEWEIRWRRDWELISSNGALIGDDRLLYNITTVYKSPLRKEVLRLPNRLADRIRTEGSEYICENQGRRSQQLKLRIPGKLY